MASLARFAPVRSRARLAPTTMAYAASVTPTTGPRPDGAAAKAHHVKGRDGERVRFRNPHPSAGTPLSIAEQLSLVFRAKWQGDMPPVARDHKIPVVEPALLPTRATPALRATWLGHACYYVEFPSGLRLLFDPVFEKTCAPLPDWLPLGLGRITPPACLPKDLPFVDAVVISHSHYDHLSLNTVRELAAAHPRARFFVGLGLAAWFRAAGIEAVTEMDWWDDAELRLAAEGEAAPAEILATVSCLPCQHTSGRTGRDKDATLWASWAVSSGGRSVWFGGDTGYRAVPRLPGGQDDRGPEHAGLPRNPDFADIGRLRGPFDLGLIPIGAYDPRWLFSPIHSDPFDAVEIYRDTRCARAMGVHWGTWVLTSEAVEDPPRLLREAARRAGLAEGAFDVCAVGETREF